MTWRRLIVYLPLVVSCGSDQATMQASWTGADTGTIAARATAVWCAEYGFVEVVGQQGDTGLALAVFPGEGGLAGSYSVALPDTASFPLAPGAALAARWFEATSLEAWQGLGGSVTIDRDEEGLLTGSFDGRLGSVSGDETLEISGVFAGVSLRTGGPECSTEAPAGSDFTGDTVLD